MFQTSSDEGAPALDQLPLFDSYEEISPPAEGEENATPVLPSSRGRPRSFDDAILRYVGYHRFVTSHQVVYRFRTYAGKAWRYGFRLINDLANRGLLKKEPLDPGRGAVSRHVLSLTDDGWLYCVESPPSKQQRDRWHGKRAYFLQMAEVRLERESTGWVFLGRSATDPETGQNLPFVLLRDWALESFKGRALGEDDIQLRESIRRAPEFKLPVDVLCHDGTGEVRLVLPVRRGVSIVGVLERMPARHLAAFDPLTFDLVCSNVELRSKAEKAIERWGKRHKLEVGHTCVPHFRTRKHPKQHPIAKPGRYEEHDVPEPTALL